MVIKSLPQRIKKTGMDLPVHVKEEFGEEIQKSWNEYVEQVGEEIASSTNFFNDALNEILAKGEQLF